MAELKFNPLLQTPRRFTIGVWTIADH